MTELPKMLFELPGEDLVGRSMIARSIKMSHCHPVSEPGKSEEFECADFA